MYTSLVWVPRGVAQTKINAEPDLAAAAALAASAGDALVSGPPTVANGSAANGAPGPSANGSAAAADSQAKPDSDSPMAEGGDSAMADGGDGSSSEQEELDMADVLANDLNSLTFYKSNKDDPILANGAMSDAVAAGNVFDPDELDDLEIRPTDALLVAANSGEEASTLEFHLFDDELDEDNDNTEYHPNVYVHHDLVLPAIPLCAAFTALRTEDSSHNLVAVGLFTPGIDIWDADQVNALLPVQRLGGYETAKASGGGGGGRRRKKSSKKPRLALREGSHSDAVLSLSWNAVQTEYLASASADHTVKIWDVESGHCACTLSHHSDKVQAVAFHPEHADVLLTGSFDQSVHVVDVRAQAPAQTWALQSDVESAHWLRVPGAAEQHVLVATEHGCMYLFDRRMAGASAGDGGSGGGNKPPPPLSKWTAHSGAVSACCVSPDVPGMFATGGVDKRVKLWCASSAAAGDGAPAKLMLEMPSRVGAVFSAALCPLAANPAHQHASPFVLAYGGQRNKVDVVDLAVENKALREHYKAQIAPAAFETMERRAARGSQAARAPRKGPKTIGKAGEVFESDDGGSDSSDHDR